MKNRRLPLFVVLCFCFLLLTGCWDEVEIEERAFLAAIAIDLAEEQGENTTFEMTEQVVVPAGLGTITQAGEDQAYRNLSQTGESIFDINTKIFRQSNRKVNIEHLGLIIVSSELAKEEKLFANVVDVFIRQQFMRRGILVAITDGKAKDFLDMTPEHIKVPAMYITELLENNQSAVISEPPRLGEIQEKLLTDRGYASPLLTMFSANSIDYEGLAIFHEPISKQVGMLNSEESKGRHFIMGIEQEGSVTSEVEGDQVTFNIMDGSSKYKLMNSDKNQLQFQIDIEITADLMEYFGTVDFSKEENLKRFVGVLEDRVKELAENTLEKLKNDLQVDILKFDNYLRIHHNKLWEEIKADWDHGKNYFSNSEVTINVKAVITEPGTSVRVNTEGD